MSRVASFLVFLLIALTLTGTVHYYLWVRLVRDAALPTGVSRVATAAFIALYCSIPLSFFVRLSGTASGFIRALMWVPLVWMGFLLLLLTTVAATELVRAVTWVAWSSQSEPVDAEKRQTLARLLAAGAALGAAALGIVAIRSGLGRVALREVSVPLARLPRSLDGTTIVQLSDVHVGPTIRRDFIERIVEQTNAASPDVIAITGDLVDGSVAELLPHVEPLGRLRAKHGVYFVTGNHEYYSGVEEWLVELERLGIRVLRNERVSIGEPEGASFDLAGIDDYNATREAVGHGPDLARALAGRDASRELVLLAHQPRAIHEAAESGVGLQLSGHTHGGQIWPWSWAVRLQQPAVSGLKQFGRTFLYVSNGTGYWGPPMRLAAPAEITKVTLRAA